MFVIMVKVISCLQVLEGLQQCVYALLACQQVVPLLNHLCCYQARTHHICIDHAVCSRKASLDLDPALLLACCAVSTAHETVC